VLQHPLSATAAVSEKPSICNYDPAAAWEIAREVRTAAAQNRRVKAAAFVLPAGGPGEPDEPRIPQGKAKANEVTLGKQQVGGCLCGCMQEPCRAVLQQAIAFRLTVCNRLTRPICVAAALRSRALQGQRLHHRVEPVGLIDMAVCLSEPQQTCMSHMKASALCHVCRPSPLRPFACSRRLQNAQHRRQQR
jgi:hypothetical protein